MDPLSMEKAMIKKMIDKTGKSIDEWIEIVKKQNFLKHNEIVTFLKKDFLLTHGYANLIAHKSK
ncbi:uncharacterized protein METZ01_LOCUS12674 [marine metagenome]|uniref:DUF4287 domain-containing protein n=1 Tax=marine metagenome TaxID=408172 RepID=A0A381NYZ3_9ZZZZ